VPSSRDERDQHLQFLEEHGADPYGEAVKHLDVGNDGFADSGQATEERAELLGQHRPGAHRVHQIDEALQRMDEGTYGICSVRQGDPGGPARSPAPVGHLRRLRLQALTAVAERLDPPVTVIARKRDGEELPADELRAFLDGLPRR
jgi:RNA polymerase-binding transcription factor DksA